MLTELVNETVLEQIIKWSFSLDTTLVTVNEPCPMSKDEENILRYTCGYVAMNLKKMFTKVSDEKSVRFIEGLNKMEIDGPESSFYDYTKEYIVKVNKAGLLKVSKMKLNFQANYIILCIHFVYLKTCVINFPVCFQIVSFCKIPLPSCVSSSYQRICQASLQISLFQLYQLQNSNPNNL